MSVERTRDEIQQLKESWRRDPSWDLEDTEGFEAHREELLAYRLEFEAKVHEDEQRERAWSRARTTLPYVVQVAAGVRACHDDWPAKDIANEAVIIVEAIYKQLGIEP